MTVGCQNEFVVLPPVTLQRTLTCVAEHLGGPTYGSISEAVQLVIVAIFLFAAHATTLDTGVMVKLVRVISLFTQMTIITSP